MKQTVTTAIDHAFWHAGPAEHELSNSGFHAPVPAGHSISEKMNNNAVA
jgi:hypothetical protein